MPVSLAVFRRIGVFPIRDHYYEPLFNPKHMHRPVTEDRALPGINLNAAEQLALLQRFQFNEELIAFPLDVRGIREFHYHNGSFESGDAEYLYNMIRLFKPSRIVEIGSGNSTLLSQAAIEANTRHDTDYKCELTCIEPFEAPWLEGLGVSVLRQRVEDVDRALFDELAANDVLFIDSSHMVRPQGDVLTEYLDILPRLNPGVLVHIHDIFLPRDYPYEWIVGDVRFWNEQYLLEAFLSHNDSFRVIGALNFLRHHYPDQLRAVCPILADELTNREPGSFWMVKE